MIKLKTLALMLAIALAAPLAPSVASAAATSKGAAAKGDKVVPGEFIVEPATLLCLGFEWMIAGDDNRNAKVEVTYRKKGDQGWKQALPLMRLQNEKINGAGNPPVFDYTAPNMFAGSIVDLEPDTAYDVRLVMTDPDGVGAGATKSLTVRTRPVPKPAAGGRVLHVYPAGYAGPKQAPAFTGLMDAYEPMKPIYNAQFNGVEPGDTILVHAGVYPVTDNHPEFLLNRSGTADKPITIKSAGDGEVIFDGLNGQVLFNAMGANYNYIEGLTMRNAGIAILAGEKKVGGAVGLSIVKCRIVDVGGAIWARYAGSKNFYIADNVMFGRQKKDGLVGGTPPGVPTQTFWKSAPGYPAPEFKSDNGIHIHGSGHVIAYNEIAYFWDGINSSFYNETPSADRNFQPVANDVYNNYIHTISDNATSLEEQLHNSRLFRNLLIDDAGSGPLGLTHNWGGPIYVFRNIVYHSPDAGALKLFSSTGGVLIYNNTLITDIRIGSERQPISNIEFKNNLILSEQGSSQGPGGARRNFNGIYFGASYTSYTVSDYNGFKSNPGASPQFGWLAPAKGLRDYVNPLVEHDADTLPQFCAATGQECHGRLVDFGVFENLSPPDPNNPTRLYPREGLDFRLKPNSAAVDAGYPLPNIDDGFTGAAPDLGALEVGQPAPHYGPRP